MSNRPDITKKLSLSLEKHLNPKNDTRIYIAKECTFDYATGVSKRVDYCQFKPVNTSVSGIEKGDFYCYEIKSSVEDFHSPNGHNFLGDYNYYVMPEDVYMLVQKEIPFGIGVYIPDGINKGGWYNLKAVKKARKINRTRPLTEILFMMFRSSNRELYKLKEGKVNKAWVTVKRNVQ